MESFRYSVRLNPTPDKLSGVRMYRAKLIERPFFRCHGFDPTDASYRLMRRITNELLSHPDDQFKLVNVTDQRVNP